MMPTFSKEKLSFVSENFFEATGIKDLLNSFCAFKFIKGFWGSFG